MVAFLILLHFAVIFLVSGIALLLYFRNKNKQKAALMGQTETSGASDVSGLAPGTLVEVKGTLRCEEPLSSEMAGEKCAYYSSKVIREYMERDYDDDDVGSDRRSEVVAHNEQFAPFVVEDSTGTLAVNTEGAEMDAKQVVNRFERNTGSEGPSISLGGTTIHLGGSERTQGYRYTETILPVDAPVYVLGTVQQGGGSVRRPATRGTVSSSATAPRRRWDKASARPSCGSAWEASPLSPSASSSWRAESTQGSRVVPLLTARCSSFRGSRRFQPLPSRLRCTW